MTEIPEPAPKKTRKSSTVVKKNPKTGKWGFVVDGPRDPATGKRTQIRVSGLAKSAANKMLTKIQHEVPAGDFVKLERMSVAVFLAEWLRTKSREVEPSTLESYRRNIELHVNPRIGGLPLQSLAAIHLNKIYSTLLESGRADGRGGLSARTVRYIATILREALSDAMKLGLVARNVADAATPPSASSARSPEMRTWSASDLAQFLNETVSSRYHSAWFVLATTGMRRGEVLGLRWRDVDFEGARLSIRQTVTLVKHEIRIAPRTKTGNGRAINLDATTIAELRAHRTRQIQEMLLLQSPPNDDTLIFSHPDGRPYNPDRFSREFDRAIARTDLPRIRLHDLRHTWATIALGKGVATKVVSERLGHTSIAITSNVYSHVSPTMQGDAAELVAAAIFGAS